MPEYAIILPAETVTRAAAYLKALRGSETKPGAFLLAALEQSELDSLSPTELIGELVDTKPPQIFAESAVAGDGSDWNLTELVLLGDVSIAMPVTIFDDGNHNAPHPHTTPFVGNLVFTPGALLRNGRGCTPADWDEVTDDDGQLSADGYYELYKRRLVPVLRHINQQAGTPRSAFVTVPGLGCGQFAGRFQGQLGVELQRVLARLLKEEGESLPNIRAIYYDSYNEGDMARHEINGISLLVRPLRRSGSKARPQLCPPSEYAEDGDDFIRCELYSLVAWDHVSWPGNDFFGGSRATDDGVKAAATNAMAVLTGVAGRYHSGQAKYLPPAPFQTWGEVVERRKAEQGLQLWQASAVSHDWHR